jgi:ferric-dicitrate binding protein FerR (iron transport regulator)
MVATLAPLTELARRSLPPARPTPDLRQRDSWARVSARLRRPGLRFVRVALGLGGLAAAGALALALLAPWRGGAAGLSPALTFAVEASASTPSTSGARSTPAAGEEIRAPGDAEASIRFSDGTDVTLDRASRGRVASLGAEGAHVKLEQGRARVKVVHRPGAAWRFDAGPCVIQVTGTSFDVSWSEEAQAVEVLLYSGSVTVRGPPAPEGITLRDGQRLRMDLRQNVAHVDRLDAAGAPAAAPSLDAPAATARAPRNEPASRTQRERGAPSREEPRGPGWPALVAAGEFGAVLAEAGRIGIDDAIARASAADAMALADAARFSGQSALARRALLAVRSRFPDSASADKAAFLLGRMAEDMEGDLGRALEWYGLYLANAPTGLHAADALGRKMTATLRLFGPATARPLATDYLRRFPFGAYAHAARAIMSGER